MEIILNTKTRLSGHGYSASFSCLRLFPHLLVKIQNSFYACVANHINYLCTKIGKTIGLINKIKHCIDAKAKRTLYCSLVLPYINYCNVVWACTYHSKLDKMYKLQKRVIRIIANVGYLSHTKSLFSKYRILSVFELNKLQIGMYVYVINV